MRVPQRGVCPAGGDHPAELIALIEELNGRDDIDGILCQLPLPQGIDEELSS